MNPPARSSASPARERILVTAYDLFTERGFRAVGVDELIARTGVAKATFYRHFPTKNSLGVAFLARRERVWTYDFLEAGARDSGSTAEEHLLGMFDVLDDWFRRPGYEGCSFVKLLLEVGTDHPLGEACVIHLANVRATVEVLAREADLADPADFSRKWHVLMKGAMVAAAEGDQDAAARMKPLARTLIEQHRTARPRQRRPRAARTAQT